MRFIKRKKDNDWFVTSWDTSIESDDGIVSNVITFNIRGYYDFYVKFGESDTPVRYNNHIGSDPGIDFTVTIELPNVGLNSLFINGYIPNIIINSPKLRDIINWGCLYMTGNKRFYNCINLINVTASDKPKRLFSLNGLFNSCASLLSVDNIVSWDMSLCTNTSRLFYNNSAFNQDISGLDVSKVKNFSSMFYGCVLFNQPLDSWDVSSGKDMSLMFESCTNFNQDISSWNVSNVGNFLWMFKFAHNFQQDLSSWNMSNAETITQMFRSTKVFGDYSNWGITDKLTDMSFFFYETALNFPLDNWDLSNVTNWDHIFYYAMGFNQDLSNISLPKLESINDIFNPSYTPNFSPENYGNFLKMLATNTNPQLLQNQTIESTHKYTQEFEIYRDMLINERNFVINDGGLI